MATPAKPPSSSLSSHGVETTANAPPRPLVVRRPPTPARPPHARYRSPTRKQKPPHAALAGDGGAGEDANAAEEEEAEAAAEAAAARQAQEEAMREAQEGALRLACRGFAVCCSSLGRSPGEITREQFGPLLREWGRGGWLDPGHTTARVQLVFWALLQHAFWACLCVCVCGGVGWGGGGFNLQQT